MDSIRFPTREFFPLFEVPSTNTSTTPFSSNPEKEVLIAIPNGKKSYLWFTNTGEDVCFSVPRNFKTHPQWSEVSTQISKQYPQPFFGTLLSGTLVYPPNNSNQNMEYFVADDIFYYAGISLSKSAFAHRLEYLCTFFHEYISIAPPITNATHSSQNKHIQIVLVNMRGINESPTNPTYRVHHWQLRNLSLVSPYYALANEPVAPIPRPLPHSNTPLTNTPNPTPSYNPRPNQNPMAIKKENKPQPEKPSPKKQWVFQYHLPAYKQKAIFKIIPEEQCDVYSIYARSHPTIQQTEWVSCGYAGIFEYNTSKLLNYHCRNITSHHLDQIEESDDEEDSPIISNSITPNPQYFECVFSAKFRKWVPICVVPHCSPEKVIEIDTLAIYGESRPARSQSTHYSQPPYKNRTFYKNK